MIATRETDLPSFIDRRTAVAALLLLLVMSAPAAAQSTREVSFGYSYLAFDEDDAPIGWHFDYASEITPLMRWVADFGGHYGGEDAIHTFQGGLRFGLSRTEQWVPFATVLMGGGYGERDENNETTLSWTAQIGAGVDYVFRPNGPGLRAQIDFPVFFVRDEADVSVRATFGFVIPFK